MQTTLIVLGIIIGVFSIGALITYFFIFYVYFSPEEGSNAHLREWLLSGGTIENYIEKFSV